MIGMRNGGKYTKNILLVNVNHYISNNSGYYCGDIIGYGD